MSEINLKQEAYWFNELTSVMSEGIYLTDKNGLVLFVNRAFTEITGIKKNEVVGKNIQDYLDEQYAKGTYKRLDIDVKSHLEQNKASVGDKPESLWAMVMKKKTEVSYASFLVNEGLKKVVLFLGHPILDEQGTIQNVIVLLQDMTQNSTLKDELTRIEDKTNQYLSEIIYHREAQIDQKGFMGNSEAIKAIKKVIANISNTDVSVLIQGETGVGKEIVAHEIYRLSQRKDKPYIKINCSAIPENLLETELFGYEPGAFSGASKKIKIGYFEMANQGTLLLDEIGDMSFSMQAKLLRVLQDQVIIRVGGVRRIALDVRIIASTSKDLIQGIKEGLFREDLYYRLNIMPIIVPPLRERKMDIAVLTQYMLEQFGKKYNRSPVLSQEAMAVLETYFWPGNVRELKNILERMVIVNGDGIVESQQVLALLGGEQKSIEMPMNTATDLNVATAQFQKKMIESALQTYKSTYKAAEALGVTQSTISRKAKALGITDW
ncbi:sigma-54-dependent Fis family transcriptional regulator [Fusibacter sp. 3D3]|uniref:sigma-54 interaction domain-containing protein n=1 Tax=Fusibacter sp. 3D3 TaxID=1048380 RepID=UPI000858DCF4|nr:sigma 54-interacting transcriptional regulator [Fusibacter sp. 3D3]GAU76870.1 response regulator of zinc sigma-54-dependent two-component system [Fusibacter sp. 3D3]